MLVSPRTWTGGWTLSRRRGDVEITIAEPPPDTWSWQIPASLHWQTTETKRRCSYFSSGLLLTGVHGRVRRSLLQHSKCAREHFRAIAKCEGFSVNSSGARATLDARSTEKRRSV